MSIGKLIFEVCNLMLSPFTRKFFANVDKNNSINRTVNLYPNPKFIKIRFWDAPFVKVEKLVPKKGFILDLGCGEGIFTNFLGISSKDRKVLGIELDRNRLKVANHGVKNVTFKWGDATKTNLPQADSIILFHVLHHLNSYEAQKSVIDNCLNKLKIGGKFIIVEVEPKFSFKYWLSYFTDHFLVPWIFEKRIYSPIFFRRSSEWESILKNNGFSCRVINSEKGHPFTHVILECQKRRK